MAMKNLTITETNREAKAAKTEVEATRKRKLIDIIVDIKPWRIDY